MQMVNPWKTYVKLSAVLMGSHGLTKGSLAFLNYPAQLMFKSTKVFFFFFFYLLFFAYRSLLAFINYRCYGFAYLILMLLY